MSVVCVAYQRRCDRCGKLHETVCETARRTIAATRRDGWQRVMSSERLWEPRIDVCPECLDAMEEEAA